MRRFTTIAVIITMIVAAAFLWPGTVNANTFGDVKDGQWYYHAVTEAANLKLVQGYPDGSFSPNRPVSYAEFVSIVSKGKPITPASGESNHWASAAMLAALNAGWYDWDEIPPTGELYDAPIPRKIAAKILAKAFVPEIKGEYSRWAEAIRDFHTLDGRYYEPVFSVYESGLVTGDELGNFNPNQGLTRAEACSLIVKAVVKFGEAPADVTLPQSSENPPVKVEVMAGGVSDHGSLKVTGTQLCAENGKPIVLRGMSSHGMQWYGNYASKGSIKTTRDYGANVFRVAMYTGEGGYLSNHKIKDKVFEAVDAAISLDMYVVLDWHILSDGNPQTHKKEAKAFFDEAAKRYAGNPAVIYEICNEPNGNVTWEKDIRPYAVEIIPIIRKHSPDAIVLVGSSTWSQDIHHIVANPLPFEHIMYTLHFYAGTHKDSLRSRLEKALGDGTPVFVSEWGTSDASGSGGLYLDEAKKWIDLMNKHNISWINWSLCDKNESSAALKPGASSSGGWKESDLSESGKFVFKQF